MKNLSEQRKPADILLGKQDPAGFPRTVVLLVESIDSHWYDDLMSDWQPNPHHIAGVIDAIARGEAIAPMVVVQENDRYVAIDGVHRLYAYRKIGLREIQVVVIEGDWASTEQLRKAHLNLKAYDEKTGYRYDFNGALKRWSTKHVDPECSPRLKNRRMVSVFARQVARKLMRRLLHVAFR